METKHVEEELDANVAIVVQIWQQNSTSTFHMCSSSSDLMGKKLVEKMKRVYVFILEQSDKTDITFLLSPFKVKVRLYLALSPCLLGLLASI